VRKFLAFIFVVGIAILVINALGTHHTRFNSPATEESGGRDRIILPSPAPSTMSVRSEAAGWQSTAVHVDALDTIQVSASGTVTYWRGKDGSEQRCGPDGVTGTTADSCYLAPGLNKNALVGAIYIDSSHTYWKFNVGSSCSVRSPSSGMLYFGINDTNNCGGTADNRGGWDLSFRVIP